MVSLTSPSTTIREMAADGSTVAQYDAKRTLVVASCMLNSRFVGGAHVRTSISKSGTAKTDLNISMERKKPSALWDIVWSTGMRESQGNGLNAPWRR